MQIWAKLIIGSKNVKDIIYTNNNPLTYKEYDVLLREIAEKLDIPSPLSMHVHYSSFAEFNFHKFKPDDFVESLGYDCLILELFG